MNRIQTKISYAITQFAYFISHTYIETNLCCGTCSFAYIYRFYFCYFCDLFYNSLFQYEELREVLEGGKKMGKGGTDEQNEEKQRRRDWKIEKKDERDKEKEIKNSN